MAEAKNAVVELIELKVKGYIEELLKSYSEKDTIKVITDPNQRRLASSAIANEVWVIIETQNPKYISELIRRVGGEQQARRRFFNTVEDVIRKRGDDYVKILRFEERANNLSDKTKERFGHLGKKEQDDILSSWLSRTKSVWKKRGELTDEQIAKIDERAKKSKEKKDAKKELIKTGKQITEKWEKGKKEIHGHGKDFFKEGFGDGEVKIGSKFDELHWTEQRDVWMRWYEQEMQNLRTALDNKVIEPDEFYKNVNSLKNYVAGKMGRRGRWSWNMKRAGSSKYGVHLLQVVQVLALSIIGVIVTASFNSLWFFFAFLSVAMYFLIPDPKNYEPKKGQKLTMMSWLPVGQQSRSPHNTTAFLKSIAKVSAIICFAYAFKDLGDVFNIFYIGIAIFGYFLLKVEYDPDVPAEFIESVFRFFIGIFFIPTIFVTIFDSWVLGAIALAFFAVPPLPAAENKNIASVLSRGLSGATAYYEMADKFVFGALMLFALIGAGVLPIPGFGDVGWELSGAMQNTFLYFWIVTAVAGFFSPAKERPVTGAIMLGAATIIYGIGPGSQAVGSGLLGDWWPTVHNTFTDVTAPLASVMDSLGQTFGQGFLLLTNPVGYATQLMNGSYTSSGTGPVGSYGVDITSLSVSPVLPTQPFVVTAILENKGAFDAKNVKMSITLASADKYATEGKARAGIIRPTSEFYITDLGFSKMNNGVGACEDIVKDISGNKECVQGYKGVLSKMLVWQAAFQSTGINCSVITGKDLRKKYIPLVVKTTYDYQSDSRVQVEFISQSEWDRKAQAGELDRGFGFVESQYTSAPVKFPIGTAGLKNPILETQQFHISMSLVSAFDTDSEIEGIKNVNLTFPGEWNLVSCTPGPKGGNTPKPTSDGMKYVEWGPLVKGPKTFACYFSALGKGKISAPTKSYVVTAHADYTFSRWKIKDTLIEFGGFCCPDKQSGTSCTIADTSGTGFADKLSSMFVTKECSSKDCLDSQLCINNACVYVQGSGGTTQDKQQLASELSNQCGLRQSYYKGLLGIDTYGCLLGMGGCQKDSECVNVPIIVEEWEDAQKLSVLWKDGRNHFEFDTTKKMTCQPVQGYTNVNVCCYEDGTPAKCKAGFEEWLSQATDPELTGNTYYYPNEDRIHSVYNSA